MFSSAPAHLCRDLSPRPDHIILSDIREMIADVKSPTFARMLADEVAVKDQTRYAYSVDESVAGHSSTLLQHREMLMRSPPVQNQDGMTAWYQDLLEVLDLGHDGSDIRASAVALKLRQVCPSFDVCFGLIAVLCHKNRIPVLGFRV